MVDLRSLDMSQANNKDNQKRKKKKYIIYLPERVKQILPFQLNVIDVFFLIDRSFD